ncbi:MAG: CehA/McbA family metallohydrolase [Pseudomonadota bacterium]
MHSVTKVLSCGALVLLLVLESACPGRTEAQAPPPPAPLDEVLGPGQVRCGFVTRPSELIGGVGAYAQVGRSLRCYNSRIRFIVQDGSRPVGNSSRGGTLIDVDLVRADETQPGEDSFRELVAAAGFNEIVVDEVRVLDDGRHGGQAAVRVAGWPAPPSLMPAAVVLSQEIPGRIEHDFVLRPDSAVIEIRSTIHNESDDALGPLTIADFWAPGRSTRPHNPRTGFGGLEPFARVPFLVNGRGDQVSYGYACKDGDLTIPLIESGITLPICTDNFYVGAADSFSRYLLVGDGSIDSVASQAWALRGIATGTVRGQVSVPGGGAASRVWISALSAADLDDAATVVVNQARSADDGSYRMTLPPGSYHLLAHIEDRGRSAVQPVQVQVESESAQDLELGGQARVQVHTSFLDRGGLALPPHPCKLSVVPLDDTPRPSRTLGEFVQNSLYSYALSVDGEFDVMLPPGRYELVVSRGFEFTRSSEAVQLVDGDSVQVQAELQHVVDSTGWIAGEFHQHTLGSVDAAVPVEVKVLENAAEGIEFAASTDHDNIVDFQPWVEALGLQPFLTVVPGNEVTYQGLGHFNTYPWTIDPLDPYRDVGTRIWWGRTIPELFGHLRQLAGDPIIQINHPRSTGGGLFTTFGIDPVHGTLFPQPLATLPTLPPTVFQDWSDNFDVIEINGSLGSPELFAPEARQQLFELARDHYGDVPVLADYFALLGAGLTVGFTGVSDSHERNAGVGYPRTFLRVDRDDPPGVDEDSLRRTMRSQRTAEGNGCLIEIFVGDARPMGLPEAIDRRGLELLRVRVQAPPFVRLDRLELYLNGESQRLRVQDGVIRVDAAGSLRLPLTDLAVDEVRRLDAALRNLPRDRDLVITAIARGSSGLWPSGEGSPFCVSAPLYVDVDGGGWTPWLADSQTLRQHPFPALP